jgi:hypothetical protein
MMTDNTDIYDRFLTCLGFETEPEKKAMDALNRLYEDNDKAMKTLAKMKVKTHVILEMAIEAGVRRGYRRAFKHVENPTEESICEHIEECVMGEIYEYFSFEDEISG